MVQAVVTLTVRSLILTAGNDESSILKQRERDFHMNQSHQKKKKKNGHGEHAIRPKLSGQLHMEHVG